MIPQEKARWTKQPPYAFSKLNRDHPLTEGIYDCIIFNSGATYQKNLTAPSSYMTWQTYGGGFGGSPVGISADGAHAKVGFNSGNSSAGYWTIAQPSASHQPGNDLVQMATGVMAAFTIRIKWKPLNYYGQTYSTLISKGSAGGRSIGIFIDASGNISYLDVGISYSNAVGVPASQTAMTVGTVWDFVFIRDFAGSITTYVNGRKIGTSANSVFSYAYSVNDSLNLNYDVHGGGTFYDAEFYIYQSWQRPLSDNEILKLYADPYCVLMPPPI
jgi:hypothetical protein